MGELAAMILGPHAGPEEEDEYQTVAAELILGINEKKPELVSKALKAFFEMCDAEPHEEGEHLAEGE